MIHDQTLKTVVTFYQTVWRHIRK